MKIIVPKLKFTTVERDFVNFQQLMYFTHRFLKYSKKRRFIKEKKRSYRLHTRTRRLNLNLRIHERRYVRAPLYD